MTSTTQQRSLVEKLYSSPYFIDMSATFGLTAISILAATWTKFKKEGLTHEVFSTLRMLPKAIFQQFLIQTLTEDLYEEGYISKSTKDLIDMFSSAKIFVSSFSTVHTPLVNYFEQFSVVTYIGTGVDKEAIAKSGADVVAKAIAFGAIPIPNLIALGNFISVLQSEGEDTVTEVTNSFPALTSALVYTPNMLVKFALSPAATTVGLLAGMQNFCAGGAGYITTELLSNLTDLEKIEIKPFIFEFLMGGYNNMMYRVTGPLTDVLVTDFPMFENAGSAMDVIAGSIESGELYARQHEPIITKLATYAYYITSNHLVGTTHTVSYDEL